VQQKNIIIISEFRKLSVKYKILLKPIYQKKNQNTYITANLNLIADKIMRDWAAHGNTMVNYDFQEPYVFNSKKKNRE
jgi:hypothetical protein